MISVLLNYVLIGIVAVALGRVGWNWWFQRDEEWEDKQRAFAHLAGLLKAGNPDSWFARAFDDMAFSDWSDLLEEMFEFAALVEGDPQVLFDEFSHQFFNVLSGKAKDPAQLALIQAEITKATTPQASAA
jgi:hypothetical protein